jgi:hypothetical protein
MERSISCDYSVRGRGVWTHVLTSARTLTVNLPEIIAHSSMDPELPSVSLVHELGRMSKRVQMADGQAKVLLPRPSIAIRSRPTSLGRRARRLARPLDLLTAQPCSSANRRSCRGGRPSPTAGRLALAFGGGQGSWKGGSGWRGRRIPGILRGFSRKIRCRSVFALDGVRGRGVECTRNGTSSEASLALSICAPALSYALGQEETRRTTKTSASLPSCRAISAANACLAGCTESSPVRLAAQYSPTTSLFCALTWCLATARPASAMGLR